MEKRKRRTYWITHVVFACSLAIVMVLSSCDTVQTSTASPTTETTASQTTTTPPDPGAIREIYLAGGCFWGVEAYMSRIAGVVDAISGYANGKTENPSYEDLIYRNSGHAETVKVVYDSSQISLEEVLVYYFKIIDPTSLNKQGNDTGSQYRTGIYYLDEADRPVIEQRVAAVQKNHEKPIVVEIEPLRHFFDAEAYHQDYLDNNPGGYCHIDLNAVNEPVIRVSQYPRPSDDEIKSRLTAEQYDVTQNSGTEAPFDNLYNDHFEQGIYVDIVTGEPLFSSRDKFHSGTGWPSFVKPIVDYVVREVTDTSLGITRVEVRSRSGDSHLGHLFEDGPADRGGRRYCINSAALRFVPLSDMASQGYGELVPWVED